MKYVWTMYEICRTCVWNAHVCIMYAWTTYGIRIEYVWDIRALCVWKRMEFARDMSMEYGICMEYEWNAYVICMEQGWDMHGTHQEYASQSYGMRTRCVEYLWWTMYRACVECTWNNVVGVNVNANASTNS